MRDIPIYIFLRHHQSPIIGSSCPLPCPAPLTQQRQTLVKGLFPRGATAALEP